MADDSLPLSPVFDGAAAAGFGWSAPRNWLYVMLVGHVALGCRWQRRVVVSYFRRTRIPRLRYLGVSYARRP